MSLEKPDAITASAVSAREKIGMAIADKIREMERGKDLEHVAEDVLPSFEKFLESPEEKRLRRIRSGVIAATVGLGLTIVTLLMALEKTDFIPFIAPGFITFLVGLGIVINGLLFTVPRKQFPGAATDALSQKALDSALQYETSDPRTLTSELGPPAQAQLTSVTEHTTHHLHTNKR
jgi:hypothetical protein